MTIPTRVSLYLVSKVLSYSPNYIRRINVKYSEKFVQRAKHILLESTTSVNSNKCTAPCVTDSLTHTYQLILKYIPMDFILFFLFLQVGRRCTFLRYFLRLNKQTNFKSEGEFKIKIRKIYNFYFTICFISYLPLSYKIDINCQLKNVIFIYLGSF